MIDIRLRDRTTVKNDQECYANNKLLHVTPDSFIAQGYNVGSDPSVADIFWRAILLVRLSIPSVTIIVTLQVMHSVRFGVQYR